MPERNPPKNPKIPETTDAGQSREPLSALVKAGQVFRYLGPDARHISSGELFIVKQVDDEREIVRIVTARDEASAARENRPPQIFMVSRTQWEDLPKQFGVSQEVRGEQ